MDLTRVDQIAKAVLYEGYMLYPYRPSSVKNRQRFNFGVLYPPAYSDTDGTPCTLRTECLVSGGVAPKVELKLRFLQMQIRSIRQNAERNSSDYQEVVERDVTVPEFSIRATCGTKFTHDFAFGASVQTGENVQRRLSALGGIIEITAENLERDVFKVSILVRNTTAVEPAASRTDEALQHSLISTHLILGVRNGTFVSLLEPTDQLKEFAAQCQNIGAWPVLVGEPGQRDTLLASPIILYDYPQIAPESAGDLFDGTEIDEILSLRIMTLTDEEKREIRESDERARQILERTENMPAEQFMKLHGAVRGMRPLKEETR